MAGQKPYVGFVPCLTPLRWQPSNLRLGNLDRSLELLLGLQRVSVDAVHTVLGCFMWLASLWRGAMSIPHDTYTFVRSLEGQKATLWKGVRSELEMMRGILPLLYADLARRPVSVVLAQDAAAPEEKLYGADHRHFGAFALAAMVPQFAEIKAVMANIQLVGRANAVPTPIGTERAPLGLAPDIPLLQRTTLPQSWFEAGGPLWRILLARRWRWSIEIVVGEMLALVAWLNILIWVSVAAVRRREVLAITDNSAVAALVARGRSPRYDLNMPLRRLAGVCALLDLVVRAPWADTAHQPADGGTRAVGDAALQTGPVSWKVRNTIIDINPISNHFVTVMREKGLECIKGNALRWNDSNVRRSTLRILESGKMIIALWNLSSKCEGGYLHTIVTGIRVAYRAGASIVIWGLAGHEAWSHTELWEALDEAGADTFISDLCMFTSVHKIRIRVAGTAHHLRSLCRRCVGSRKCTRTGRAHVSALLSCRAPPLNEPVCDHGRSDAWSLGEIVCTIAPYMAELAVSILERGDPLEAGANRHGRATAPGFAPRDAEDLHRRLEGI